MAKLAELFGRQYLCDEGGVDFAAIRLHYAGVNEACRTLGARAFAVGPDIYFADGAFKPHTRAGLWLLAHEVAHVVQESASAVHHGGTGSAPSVAPAQTLEEKTADAAADAFTVGQSFRFSAVAPRPCTAGRQVVRRYMAWEHALLGDLVAGELEAMAVPGSDCRQGGSPTRPIDAYRALLEALGSDPRRVDEERLRAYYPNLETVLLPGSGLVVTLGELNVLPDYLGSPSEIETVPRTFLEPLVQSIRGWSIAELPSVAARRRRHRRLPGALRYPLLGGLAESAEVLAVDTLGRRSGLAPARRYASILARNAAHFAPFSWYCWHSYHLAARALIERSADVDATGREVLRTRARIVAGYADHFLQDSFAAGHLVNKTLLMQWYIEWLAESGASYPDSDVLTAMTVTRQPLLHGRDHYDRHRARIAQVTAWRPGAAPGPPYDPQTVVDTATLADRVAASGVTGSSESEKRAAYAAYLTMLGSATVQLGARAAHDYLNERSIVVSSGPDGPRFRLFGDRTMLSGTDGTRRAVQAAATSRRAISELLRHGHTDVSSWEIFESFPDHVEQDGRLISLEDWHRTALRDLCFSELFGRWSTRATRLLVSYAIRHLGTHASDDQPF